MEFSRTIKLLGLIAAGVFTTQVQAVTINFSCIANNGSGTCDTAEAQMLLDVTASGTDGVLFSFSNNDVGTGTDYGAIIGEVYFYDGDYLDTSTAPTIINGNGVNFQTDKVRPDSLPGYSGTPLSVFAAADVKKNTADGVAVNDGTLGILFTLLPDADFNTILNAFDSGALVVGIHAKAIGSGDESESLITTTVVPVPAAVWLFGSGLLALAGVARRRIR